MNIRASLDYVRTNILWTSATTVIERGLCGDNRRVVLKRSAHPVSSPRDIARLKYEHDLLTLLDGHGAVRSLGLFVCQGKPALVLEDSGGVSLETLLRENPPDLSTALQWAVLAADALAAVHGRGVLHKDVKPGNIIVDTASASVWFIDFDIGTTLSHEMVTVTQPHAIEGTLAYMSPEHTGQTHREIDHRSDLYSLGVTLYELFVGAQPFQATDAREWVSTHLLRVPAPMHECATHVPPMLSRIVAKLLEKAPEARYQTAKGLAHDLRTCERMWKEMGAVGEFPLGERDFSERIAVPPKIYGRDAEFGEIRGAFTHASGGRPTLALVSGNPGVGKSSLIAQVLGSLNGEALVCSGKFEALRQDQPLSAILAALRDWIRQRSNPTHADRWKRSLASQLAVLVDVLPELEQVVGGIEKAPPVGLNESKARFELALHAFVRELCRDTPLVMFLDDIHWADPASLAMMERFLDDPENIRLFILGAYRDDEASQSGILQGLFTKLHKARVPFVDVPLLPLGLAAVEQLLTDTLGESSAIAPLARHLFAKTGGNPFYLRQVLRALDNQRVFVRDLDTGAFHWRDDIDAIALPNDAARILAQRLESLPETTKDLLSFGAVIGHEFTSSLVSRLIHLHPAAIASSLMPALEEGLLIPVGTDYRWVASLDPTSGSSAELDARYRFAHDRVREASYQSLEPSLRKSLHLAVGRVLVETHQEPWAPERLFATVEHFFQGATASMPPDERRDVARLALHAARKARQSAGFVAAARFVDLALSLQSEASTEDALFVELLFERAECRYLAGQPAEADNDLNSLLEHDLDNITRASVYTLRMRLRASEGRFPDAMAEGTTALALLGIELPKDPASYPAALERASTEIDILVQATDLDAQLDAPMVVREETKAAFSVMAGLGALAVAASPVLSTIVLLKQLELTISSGHTRDSAPIYANYGVVLASQGRYDEAARFWQFSLALVEKLGAHETMGRVRFLLGVYGSAREGLAATLDHFICARDQGLAVGGLFYASSAAAFVPTVMFLLGHPLDEVRAEVERAFIIVRRTKDKLGLGYLTALSQVITELHGVRLARPLFDDALDLNGSAFPERLVGLGLGFLRSFYHTCATIVHAMRGDFLQARAQARQAIATDAGVRNIFWLPERHFWTTFVLGRRAAEESGDERAAILNELHRADETFHQSWMPNATGQEAHRTLVMALQYEANGDVGRAMDHYERAIAFAEGSGLLHVWAIAHECAGRMHMAAGRKTAGLAHIAEAVKAYEQWCGTSKTRQLQAAFGAASKPVVAKEGTRKHFTTTARGFVPTLDLQGLAKVMQSIAGDTVLDKIVESLLQTIVSSSGAERGALVLRNGANLDVVAHVESHVSRVLLREPISVGACTFVPENLVRHVARTREVVSSSSTSDDAQWAADPYFRKGSATSVCCAPLLHAGRLTGVVYLENSRTENPFSSDIVDLCALLAAQGAIAIENARLYSAADEQIRQRTAELARIKQRLEVELRERQQLEEARNAMQQQLVAQQRRQIIELSAPFVPISDHVYVMPLVGVLDDERAKNIFDVALQGAGSHHARTLILDMTGVPFLDESALSLVERLTRALQLLGTKAIVTGLRGHTAKQLAARTDALQNVATMSTLKAAVAFAMKNKASRAS